MAMTYRRIWVFALSALTVAGMAAPASAANERRQRQQPTRTLGAGVTVTQTRNALTASASITDTVQPTTTNRRRASRPDTAARVRAQRARLNQFVRERVEGLQKLDSYRRLQSPR
jgi:hypothetical protein